MVGRLAEEPNTEKVLFDFCALGMAAPNDDGRMGPALKRTCVMTNAKHVAATLQKARCRGEHKHVVLQGGKAKECEVYPEFFCDAVCNGVRLELEDQKWLDKIYEKMESTYMQGTINQIQESIEKLPVPK